MKRLMILALAALLLLGSAVAKKSGSIWTTTDSCGEPQNSNHYEIGDKVYINGANFDAGNYGWFIEGKPGQASCDPNIKVVQDSFLVGQSGEFCFEAYIIQQGDCGEYTADFDGKKDNYRVDEGEPVTEVPEFGTVASLVVLAGAGLFVVSRRKA